MTVYMTLYTPFALNDVLCVNVKLVPIQGILEFFGLLLSCGVGRCSPKQTQLLSTAQHKKQSFVSLNKFN